ncbi:MULTISPECIES: SGNH/GDSL hydrolase family protein [Paenibacillus]|uniref:SGNH/GDSL hydrolase family protein n=1 Tax=Paenibacillus TaxID=44249 RepID=UPI00073E9748|nr:MULTISPECIES: SGNH/GDSL hydrolase family protein [Paenibacillus]MDU4694742.1 SGNH/GDSL hydrolase family protein [Paenibacillus sp.]
MKWHGRSWGTLGDSITAANGYQPLVSTVLGFDAVHNYGRSGCPMAAGGDTDEGATVNVGRGIHPVPDCVTIFAGTNDYRLNKPLGDRDSKNLLTFIGAYVTLIEHILSENPAARLNLWTPLQRDKDGYDTERPNKAGHRLDDYANAVRDLGRHYALPVLDLYAESGLNKLTLSFFTEDGLHPNLQGHKRIASMAVAFLERL